MSANLQELTRTLHHLYGDLLDLPLLTPAASGAAPSVSVPTGSSAPASLAALAEEIRFCQACVLHIGRRQLVFGRGSPDSRIAFFGDHPSISDDAKGEPFSDDAGELLHKMILAMKLRPEETYLTNLFKCHPPKGQIVDTAIAGPCTAHLQAQLAFLRAEVIVVMGEAAARVIAHSEAPLPVLRKQEFSWMGRRIFCTHHPRDLLHSPAKKKEAWEDLQIVMRALGEKR